jgi:hypothetical protein
MEITSGFSFPGHEIPFNCKDVWGSLLCQALHFWPCLKKIICQGQAFAYITAGQLMTTASYDTIEHALFD